MKGTKMKTPIPRGRKNLKLIFLVMIAAVAYILLTWHRSRVAFKTDNESVQPYRGKTLIVDWGPYTDKNEFDEEGLLDVGKCYVTTDKSLHKTAAAVAIAARILIYGYDFPPSRVPEQRWVYVLDESPVFTQIHQYFSVGQLGGVFNWSMTYRQDSDVPIPYGWREALPSPRPPLNTSLASKPKLVAAAISNCGYTVSGRLDYIRELQKHVQVDVYGGCGPFKCTEKLASDAHQRLYDRVRQPCVDLLQYKFYLSFENCKCHDYITEKFWDRALGSGIVPVVMGAPKEDYVKVAPPDSFIHVDDFTSQKELGEFLLEVAADEKRFAKYFEWTSKYRVKYRHQFFNGSDIWGRLCRKLTDDPAPPVAVISDLKEWWAYDKVCERYLPSIYWWIPRVILIALALLGGIFLLTLLYRKMRRR